MTDDTQTFQTLSIGASIAARAGVGQGRARFLPVALLVLLAVVSAAAHLVLLAHPSWVVVPLTLLDDLFILGVGIGVLILAAALGHRLLSVAGIFTAHAPAERGAPTRLDRGLIGLTAGWALLSTLLLALGLAGALSSWSVLLLLACILILSWPSLYCGLMAVGSGRAALWSLPRSGGWRPGGIFLAILVSLTVLVMALALLYTLVPPTTDDAMIYHLAGPQAFLRAGRIEAIPLIRLGNMPMTTEMLYLVTLVLRSPSSAQVIHWGFAVLTMLVLISCGRWLYPQRPISGVLAALLFALTPMVALLAGWAFIDLALTFAVTMTIYASLRWIDAIATRSLQSLRPWSVTAGLAGGLALGAKYTALFPVGLALISVAFASILCWRTNRRSWWALVRPLLFATVLLLLVAGPWYGKNWRWFGNPLYPVSVSGVLQTATTSASPSIVPLPAPITPGQNTSSAGQSHLKQAPTYSLGTGHTWQDYLRLPWDVITQQRRFSTTPPVPLSPFFLLAPLGLWGARSRRWPAMLGGLAVAGFAFWAIGYPDMRYYLPYVPLWCLLAAGAVSRVLMPLEGTGDRSMQRRQPRGAVLRLGRAPLVAVLAMTGLSLGLLDWDAVVLHNGQAGGLVPDALAVAIGTESRQNYLADHLSNARALLYLNSHAPPTARVLFVWNDRIFWSRLDAIPDQGEGTFSQLLAADAAAQRTHTPFVLPDGATYLLVSHETAVYYQANGWALSPGTIAQYTAMDALARRRLVLLYHDPDFAVYKVRPSYHLTSRAGDTWPRTTYSESPTPARNDQGRNASKIVKGINIL